MKIHDSTVPLFALLFMILLPTSAGAKSLTLPGGPPLPPLVLKVEPSFGHSDTAVTVRGRNLDGVTAIMFGGFTAWPFGQGSTQIRALAPLGGVPGSTVPVTAIINGETIQTRATFSYPIAQMDVMGPLPYDLQDIFDMNWSDDERAGGGHHIVDDSPGTLMFATASPVLHISTHFRDASDVHPESLPRDSHPPYALGNQGSFAAQLWMCDVTKTASPQDSNSSCTNWDNNQGAWVAVDSEQQITLNSTGAGTVADGDIAVPAASAFDEANLARTFRLRLSLRLADTFTGDMTHREEALFTKPFTVVVAPAALVQTNVLPYTIVYHPPGNQSKVTFSTTKTFGTNFSVGNSNDISNTEASSKSSSTKFSLDMGFGVAYSGSRSDTWDKTTRETFGTNTSSSGGAGQILGFTSNTTLPGDARLIPGSGDVCGSPTDCSHTKHIPDTLAREPFWKDVFVLLVHPQFAVWVLGSGPDRYVMYGAVPVRADITVMELAACATKQRWYGQDACEIEYTDSGLNDANGNPISYTGTDNTITLSQSDAINLLKLDPFYAAGQGAGLDPTRVIKIASVSYGAKIGAPPVVATETFTNTVQDQRSNSKVLTHSTDVVEVFGSDESNGFQVKVPQNELGLAGGEGLTLTNGDKHTSGTAIKISYSDSEAVSKQAITTCAVELNDVDNTTPGNNGPMCKDCHDPLPQRPSVDVYLDRVFGSCMFQDPRAPRTGPIASKPWLMQRFLGSPMFRQRLLEVVTLQEQSRLRFSDVANDSLAKSAIGLLARAHIMSGYPDHTFHPNNALTRAELATILTNALKLPAGSSRNTLIDIPVDHPAAGVAPLAAQAGIVTASATTLRADVAVSRQEFAAALARAFNLKKAAPTTFSDSNTIATWAQAGVLMAVTAHYMSPFPDGSFKPTVEVTRADAAQALFAVLKDRESIEESIVLRRALP